MDTSGEPVSRNSPRFRVALPEVTLNTRIRPRGGGLRPATVADLQAGSKKQARGAGHSPQASSRTRWGGVSSCLGPPHANETPIANEYNRILVDVDLRKERQPGSRCSNRFRKRSAQRTRPKLRGSSVARSASASGRSWAAPATGRDGGQVLGSNSVRLRA
jgi:hypothetical protein